MSIITLALLWKVCDVKNIIISSTKFSYDENCFIYPVIAETNYYVIMPSYWDENEIKLQNDFPYNIEGFSLATRTVSIEPNSENRVPGRNMFYYRKTELSTVFINTSNGSLKNKLRQK